ncbi:hypothetical protein BDQ17DRAFT_1388567 [Cyathus striatus]|nr:hypothetical protein BDQ17DRAFT_1388567 [Cyathus striatus]
MPNIPVFHHHDQQSVFDLIDHQFQLPRDVLVDLTKAFLDEFKLGLESYGHDMAMIPTFVTGVPDGTETGTFLALDLGGTNLRVCEVVLKGDKTFSLVQQKYRVSETLKQGEATALFDYLADSVDAFLTTHATTDYTSPQENPSSTSAKEPVHLGLTFSFPVEQTALDSGKILTWTKGFSAKNAIGNDVVKLLQDAFDRKHMHVKCVALVNDTVGALLSRAYTAGGCFLGAIFGTGTNGAYIEEVAKIKKMAGSPAAARGGFMVVNTEWGAFNNSRSHLPLTPFDNAVDRLSINPRYQAFEKFVSGMYLGEVTRNLLLALVDAAPKAILFNGKSSSVLNKHYGLDTSFMIAHKLEQIRKVIVEHLGYQDSEVTLKDAAVGVFLYRSVGLLLGCSSRSLLSGVAVAATLIQTDRANLPGEEGSLKYVNDTLGVGVDGSLIEHYPNFERILRESLRLIVGESVERRVDIGMAKDGSGVGAALCALQALKQGH